MLQWVCVNVPQGVTEKYAVTAIRACRKNKLFCGLLLLVLPYCVIDIVYNYNFCYLKAETYTRRKCLRATVLESSLICNRAVANCENEINVFF